MTILSRFIDERAIRASIAGCPLASTPASRDESACATCRFNVLWPTHSSIGCTTSTPAAIFERAFDRLRARDPSLADDLARLREVRSVEGKDAQRWLALVDAWAEALDDDAEREVAAVAARFAHAALKLDTPVTILGAR